MQEEQLEKMKEMIELSTVEGFVKNNEIPFTANEVEYKCVKPSFKQRQELYQERVDKYLLLKNEKDVNGNFKYSLEEALIEEYKVRGVDISKLDSQFKALQSKKENFQKKITKALEGDRMDSELENYAVEVQKLENQQRDISEKKSGLLEYSLERQVHCYIYSFMAFLVTYKKEGENWVKAWNTYDEFINAEEDAIVGAVGNACLVFSTDIGIQ